ncbi:MAG: NAD-glutamate dehydrogenase [Rhodospirillales bacterium]
MPRTDDEQQKTDLIATVVRKARRQFKGKRRAAADRFLSQYYRHVPPHDLLEQSPDTLFGAALAHLKLGTTRIPGKSSVRVYNPSVKKDGWRSDRTVVEIVTDDMPFLVDSVTAELNRQGLTVHLIIHPILKVRRDRGGRLAEVLPAEKSGTGVGAESFMRFEVTAQSGARLAEIAAGVEAVINDVRAAVEDWRPIRNKMAAIIEELESVPADVPAEDAAEVRDFLQWIHDDHFAFLGFREYKIKGDGKRATVSVNRKAGLGILRDPEFQVFRELQNLASMPPDMRAFASRPELLMVTKTNRKSTVHRPVHMDFIGVKRFNAQGKVVSQRMFVGLFTSTAYNWSARDIPLLRRKLQKTCARAGFEPASHDGKALLNILETFPRDELFQISEDQLFHTAMGILHLQDRQRVALFLRRDDFERFISCLLYVPRDRYTMALRESAQKILEKAFAGEIAAFTTLLGDDPLARVHMIFRTTAGRIPAYDAEKIEAELIEAARSWTDHLSNALIAACGEEKGLTLYRRYEDAFPPGYRDEFDATEAVADIAVIEETLNSGELGMNLYRPPGAADSQLRFKVYHPDAAIPLSHVLPMLEHMGLTVVDEIPHAVSPQGAGTDMVMIQDFGLETRNGAAVNLGAIRGNFHDTFDRVWRGEVESDGFNGLVLSAGLAWREVVILRAYCKYLRQAGIAFSQAYMEQTLANNPTLTRQIVALFETLFDPARAQGADARAARILKALSDGLDSVASADEDRILRRFINLVDSTLRTNYFQRTKDGAHKPYVSFKLDSRKVEDLPLPRPLREIFVYSPRMEGIHLRFGKVARGGIRWSDRREDFRTEILGLVKAQQVKNAVIVPVGSKGGFVLKRPPAGGGREAFQNEGIACYKTLISGMLDITDNLKGPRVAPPADVVRRDDDDPYLVVAADKGTATFSDIANQVSADYGFWLGDAFASGGSQGYDHKKMGITARGAWESVKRHFREMAVDTQADDFTVLGVGDMSGDVFGNGMLLSPHIKLVAAFNHMHIFIDPNPDPAKSFAERERLFKLPRSGWADYDRKLLSRGGAVFERRAKSLKLTAPIKKRFGISKDKVTPNELIRALLGAEVDLLWFGGIGTYVKATRESNAEVGDRANDAIRIDAANLRCRVIGEGANLGVTQRARVEYALAGGRLNTDSIDNSGGVDCSDHEVNIKILLDSAVAKGELSEKQRNALLARMTDEVAQLVLTHNYLQTQAMSLVQARGADVLDDQVRLMRRLERTGRLDRAVEFLPDEETLEERAQDKLGLTRPEIAVLMSYSKIWLYDEILDSDLPDDAKLAEDLVTYFPGPVHDRLKTHIARHRLRREIIATRVTNSMINRVGGTFVAEFMEKTGMAAPDIARAYTISRQVFAFRELWEAIASLDTKVPAAAQTSMTLDINRLIEWTTLWFLRHGERRLDIGGHVAKYKDGIATLADCLDEVLPPHYLDDLRTRGQPYLDQGVPEDLALRIAGLVNLFSGCDIVRLAGRRKLPVPRVAKLYFAVGTRFKLGRLRAASGGLESESHWQKLAVAALVEEIYGHQLALTDQVLDFSDGATAPAKAIDAWIDKNHVAVERTEQLLSELRSTAVTDISMVAVASRQLRALAETRRRS